MKHDIFPFFDEQNCQCRLLLTTTNLSAACDAGAAGVRRHPVAADAGGGFLLMSSPQVTF